MMPEANQARTLALERNSIGQLEEKELSKLTVSGWLSFAVGLRVQFWERQLNKFVDRVS